MANYTDTNSVHYGLRCDVCANETGEILRKFSTAEMDSVRNWLRNRRYKIMRQYRENGLITLYVEKRCKVC